MLIIWYNKCDGTRTYEDGKGKGNGKGKGKEQSCTSLSRP